MEKTKRKKMPPKVTPVSAGEITSMRTKATMMNTNERRNIDMLELSTSCTTWMSEFNREAVTNEIRV